MPATLSIQGLLTADPTIFDDMALPDGIDRDAVEGAIFMECSPFEVLIPQPALFKRLLSLFSARRLPVWSRLYESTIQRYDMLSDEEYSDTTSAESHSTRTPNLTKTSDQDGNSTRTPDLTTTGQNGGTDTVEQQVSAYNSEDYANREKQITTLGSTNTIRSSGTDSTDTHNTSTTKESGTDTTEAANSATRTVSGRHTSAAALLAQEREAALFDVYHFIAQDIKCNFFVMVY